MFGERNKKIPRCPRNLQTRTRPSTTSRRQSQARISSAARPAETNESGRGQKNPLSAQHSDKATPPPGALDLSSRLLFASLHPLPDPTAAFPPTLLQRPLGIIHSIKGHPSPFVQRDDGRSFLRDRHHPSTATAVPSQLDGNPPPSPPRNIPPRP